MTPTQGRGDEGTGEAQCLGSGKQGALSSVIRAGSVYEAAFLWDLENGSFGQAELLQGRVF